MGMHWEEFIFLPIFLVGLIGPILVGLIWMRPDADRRGQPGWLWALLTVPFGWITVIVYAVIRAL